MGRSVTTRNPAYLSMTMICVDIASFANALWAILLLPVALLVIQRGVTEREERYLERKFGEAFSTPTITFSTLTVVAVKGAGTRIISAVESSPPGCFSCGPP